MRLSDHGSGLSREVLAKLFRPFFGARPKSSGLGLEVSRRIAWLRGGDVRAGDRTAGGACFAMWLTEGAERAPGVRLSDSDGKAPPYRWSDR